MVAAFFMFGLFTRDYRLYWNHLPYFVTEKKKTRFVIFLFFFGLIGQIIISFFIFGMANLRQEWDSQTIEDEARVLARVFSQK